MRANGLGSGLRTCPGCQTSFHTYSVIIDRRHAGHEQIRWYLDGHQFYSVSESRVGTAAWTAAIDHGHSILLSLAMGGCVPRRPVPVHHPHQPDLIQRNDGRALRERLHQLRTPQPGSGGASSLSLVPRSGYFELAWAKTPVGSGACPLTQTK